MVVPLRAYYHLRNEYLAVLRRDSARGLAASLIEPMACRRCRDPVPSVRECALCCWRALLCESCTPRCSQCRSSYVCDRCHGDAARTLYAIPARVPRLVETVSTTKDTRTLHRS